VFFFSFQNNKNCVIDFAKGYRRGRGIVFDIFHCGSLGYDYRYSKFPNFHNCGHLETLQ
jgi:hypothetical protein